jgi:ABC-2 type transport system ATP-binding protein
VDGLSLEVAVGEVFGLLGPNGAGKTTTINMACGLLRPDAGEILVRGESLARVQAEHRRWLGLCPQSIVLWERLTCLEQLELLGRLHGITVQVVRGRALELLERLGLSDKARCQARTLSGGMQRRLNLAMALIHDPAMVVLDEPEAGLDPQSRVLVREYVRSLAHDKTILLTTHNMDEAERMADRIAVIDQGRLLTIGTPKELLVRYGKDGQPAPDLEYVFLALTGRRLRE